MVNITALCLNASITVHHLKSEPRLYEHSLIRKGNLEQFFQFNLRNCQIIAYITMELIKYISYTVDYVYKD